MKGRCWHTWILNYWKKRRREKPEEPCPHGQVAVVAARHRHKKDPAAWCMICGHSWPTAQAYYDETRKK